MCAPKLMCTANFLISVHPHIPLVTTINCLSHNDFDLDYRIDSRICLTFLNMRIINCLSQNEWMVSTIELVDFPEQHFLINLIKKISLRKWRQLFICSPLMLYWKVIKLEQISQSLIVKIWPHSTQCENVNTFQSLGW